MKKLLTIAILLVSFLFSFQAGVLYAKIHIAKDLLSCQALLKDSDAKFTCRFL